MRRGTVGVMILLAAAAARAEVASVGASGFELREHAAVKAAPAAVWNALTSWGSWWDSSHTYSGDASNLTLDPRPGGCLCEKWSSGGVQHMIVVFAMPGKTLRLSGGLGPLQAEGVAGSLTIEIEPAGESTSLRVTYAVGGYFAGGFDKLAPAVDQVLGEQLERLRRFAETGKPGK